MEEYAYLMSDLHTEQQQYRPEHLPEGDIILAGDITNGTRAWDWLEKHNHNIVYVMGNHEYDGYQKDQLDQLCLEKKNSNVQPLLCRAIETKTAYIMGATLWASWSAPDERVNLRARELSSDEKNIQYSDTQPWNPEIAKQQHEFEKKELQRMWRAYKGQKTKIVVTHHPPTVMSLIKAGMPLPWVLPNAFDATEHLPTHTHRLASYTTLDEEWLADAAKHGVQLWCHGHLHRKLDYMHHGIRIVCNPKGYKKEKRALKHQYKDTQLNITNPIKQWIEQERVVLLDAVQKSTSSDYHWTFLAEQVRDWYNVCAHLEKKVMSAKIDYEKSKLVDLLGNSR